MDAVATPFLNEIVSDIEFQLSHGMLSLLL
jgi:hypothetical protein